MPKTLEDIEAYNKQLNEAVKNASYLLTEDPRPLEERLAELRDLLEEAEGWSDLIDAAVQELSETASV